MTAPLFVDTNVLLYAVDASNHKKHEAARAWRKMLWETQRGRLSFQVLQEFYANVLRKWPGSKESARAEITDLFAWRPIVISQDIVMEGWALQDRYGFSFWDALIVAAARASSCAFLLSEDFQAGQKINGIEIVNPFAVSPQEIN
jgi:predicted nucleic acid-binding protein